jgi:hypothetical protein
MGKPPDEGLQQLRGMGGDRTRLLPFTQRQPKSTLNPKTLSNEVLESLLIDLLHLAIEVAAKSHRGEVAVYMALRNIKEFPNAEMPLPETGNFEASLSLKSTLIPLLREADEILQGRAADWRERLIGVLTAIQRAVKAE